MGHNAYIQGVRPADEDYKNMYTIYEACEKAGVDVPDAVLDFFEGVSFEYVPEDTFTVEIPKDSWHEWTDDTRQHFDVDLTKIPSDIKMLRFTNSW